MFTQNLNERQQGILLHFADEVMRVDGHIHSTELVALDQLRSQMIAGMKAEEVPVDALPDIFKLRLSRVCFLFELVGMGYANENFEPKQSDLVNRIAKEFGFDNDGIIEAIEDWVKDELAMMKRAQELMKE